MSKFLGYEDFVSYIAGNYQFLGQDGAQMMAERRLGELVKSLATTGIVPADGTTGADALKQEDLLPTIMSTELTAQFFAPFWTALHKKPTISDVVQQTNLTDYGGPSKRGGGFIDSSLATGGISAIDPALDRRALPVKFMGAQYQVLRSALAVEALGLGVNPDAGNAEQVAAESRLQQLIIQANWMAWHGRNAVNSHEPSGVLDQIRSEHTAAKPTRFNLNGSPITQETMADIKRLLYSNGAIWTQFWAPPTVLGDIEKQLIPHTRFSPGEAMTIGNYADQILTQGLGGDTKRSQVYRDDHLSPKRTIEPTVAESGAPLKPASVSAAASNAASTNVWSSYLPAGSYYYSVAAVGLAGVVSDVTAASVVAPTAAQKVTLTITNAAQAAGTVKYFEIYRGTSTTNRQYLTRIAAESVGSGGTATFVDDGEWVPGTSTCAALQILPRPNNNYDIQVRQLLPILKVKLPTALFAEQGGWVLGFTPQVCMPAFQLILENVGQLS